VLQGERTRSAERVWRYERTGSGM
jgi:Domain of unknown function (DUF4062)